MTMPAAPLPRAFDPTHPEFGALTGTATTDAAKTALLTTFATDNGLTYRPLSQALTYPGCIFTAFSVGEMPLVRDRLSTTSGRVVDIGNFEPYARPVAGPNLQLQPGPPGIMRGFVALQMDRQLPNMMLISKHRVAGDEVLPFTPDQSQTLSLEGDFDSYFTLFCPKEFEQDALYVFTPDLMALLIDEATPFDVEIVDTWLFLYASHAFEPLDPGLYRRIFTILDTIGSKVVGQTSFFTDPELGSPPSTTPVQGWHFVPNPALSENPSPAGTRLTPKSQRPGLYLGLGAFAGICALIVVVAYWTSGRF